MQKYEYSELIKNLVFHYLNERLSYDHNRYKYSYDDIAIIVGISKHQVYKIAKEFNLTRKNK